MLRVVEVAQLLALVLMLMVSGVTAPPLHAEARGADTLAQGTVDERPLRASLAGMAGCSLSADFFTAGPDLTVHASAVWDDGSGSALYVGGEFRTAGPEAVGFVAKWDGTSWSSLEGTSGIGTDGPVYALEVWDDGGGEQLYVGGDFLSAGGQSSFFIASWDGTDWSPLGTLASNGVNGPVRALTVFDDGGGADLYLGGEFTHTAGAIKANRVASWDGTSWSALTGPFDSGTDDDVLSLAVYDDGGGSDLYAGGRFSQAGGVTIGGVARWDGTTWTGLESGTSGVTWALLVHDDGSGPELFVSGLDTNSLSTAVVAWDGSQFRAIDGPDGKRPFGAIFVLAQYDDGGGTKLYAGGNYSDFRDSSNAIVGSADNIAVWDGSDWSSLSGAEGQGVTGEHTSTSSVRALSIWDDGGGADLYALGEFLEAGGVAAFRMAAWDGTDWDTVDDEFGHGIESGFFNLDRPVVNDAVEWDDGSGLALYVGGEFAYIGGVRADNVARWDGTEWSALAGPSGFGTDGPVEALQVFDDGSGSKLFVGGDFETVGAISAMGIATWNGTGWSRLEDGGGNPIGTQVSSFQIYDDGNGSRLFVGTPGGVRTWDGALWESLPSSGEDLGAIEGMVPYDGGSGEALFVVGRWDGYSATEAVQSWDGSQWSDVGSPSLAAFSGESVATADLGSGELLFTAGNDWSGDDRGFVVQWDGAAWSDLAGPSGTGVDAPALTLAAQTEGTSTHLYAGGEFDQAGGVAVDHLARWDGSEWSSVDGASFLRSYYFLDPEPVIRSLTRLQGFAVDTLFVSGDFVQVDDLPARGWIARDCAVPPPPEIFADGFESGDTSAWSATVP